MVTASQSFSDQVIEYVKTKAAEDANNDANTGVMRKIGKSGELPLFRGSVGRRLHSLVSQ